ncbi:hypothetical protein ACSLBF_00985 [Pseudoalteromonas sp. T1lg65]|uniref:hypothetical protein n=1 Tax=Pseudoalteromonas sp. T1lg65 TaxID=2077101 RepID=UPI003F7B2C5A
MKKILALLVLFLAAASAYMILKPATSEDTQEVKKQNTFVTERPIAPPSSSNKKNTQQQSTDSSSEGKLTPNNSESKIVEDTAMSHKSIESLSQLISHTAEANQLYSQPFHDLTQEKLDELISNLRNELTTQRAAMIEGELHDDLTKVEFEQRDLLLKDLACSDQLCALTLEGTSQNAISQALDQLTQRATFKESTRGGLMRVTEYNGMFYGVMLTSISEKPLSIK